MDQARPHGATKDAQYGFSKTFVHDLEAMHAFYTEVFGLIEMFRHEDEMFGRPIAEIGYMSTYPGGPALTLISYKDSTGPLAGEAVQGFTSTDLEALVARAAEAGGTVPGGIRRIEEFKLNVAFVLDPEGHVNEVVQMDA